MLYLKSSIFCLLLTFSACSIGEYTHSNSKLIIIKTDKMKFADLGYVKQRDKSIRLELFVAGQNVQIIEINHLICLNEGCMLRSNFNSEYLSENYPDTILQNIVLGTPIYNKKNLQKNEDGFEQKIQTSDVDILYRVTSKEHYFKDKKNKILFKIKDIQ